eukprot:7671758-Alexandrium_andersonii.AAC.1
MSALLRVGWVLEPFFLRWAALERGGNAAEEGELEAAAPAAVASAWSAAWALPAPTRTCPTGVPGDAECSVDAACSCCSVPAAMTTWSLALA